MNPYPDDWPDIAVRIKNAADWRCENCGHPHDPAAGRTLTVHHLDLDPSNCADDNLIAVCQVCHLSIQARYRPGQLILPGFDPYPWIQFPLLLPTKKAAK